MCDKLNLPRYLSQHLVWALHGALREAALNFQERWIGLEHVGLKHGVLTLGGSAARRQSNHHGLHFP